MFTGDGFSSGELLALANNYSPLLPLEESYSSILFCTHIILLCTRICNE